MIFTPRVRMSAVGHERRFSQCLRAVRCTSDSGKIAAPQRTDVKGHKRTHAVQRNRALG
jgi:hypothetical protein